MARHFKILFGILTLCFSAHSETFKIPSEINVRTSINFYGSSNVIGNLPEGTEVEILDKRELRSGAQSLTVRVISPESKKYLNEQSPIYIWQSKEWQKLSPAAASQTEAQVVCLDGSCKQNLLPQSFEPIKDVTHKIEEQDNTQTPENSTLEQQIQNYSNSEQVKKTIDWAYEKNKNKNSSFTCYRAVKEALANKTKSGKGPGNNLTKSWYSSQKAKDGVTDLKKRGFINLLDHSPYNETLKDVTKAPKGAVLVYKTTRHRFGHIEIKLDDGENSRYAADYVSNRPITRSGAGKTYTLLGVMIKPDAK